MSQQKKTENRDEVLFAFHQACVRPTAEEIIAWSERYPQFAEDIRAHAAISRDWAACQDLPAEEADETMLARAYSNALNELYKAEVRTSSAETPSAARTFHETLGQRGKEIYQLADELDIARGVLADLFNGAMLPPIRQHLKDGVMSALAMTRGGFEHALTFALQNPRLGHAKADKAPTVIQRRCDEIIRDSGMPAERIRYWLEED
jgi:hypothetical protein